MGASRAVRVAVLLASIALVAASCSSSGSSTEPATATTSSTATSSTSAPTSTSAAGGCAGDRRVPEGARTKQVVDVDGDGRPDTAYVSGSDASIRVGIVTASGGGDDVPYDSASGANMRKALVVNADERGPAEIILDDGRVADLDVFVGCHIRPVVDAQGRPYTFDLGFGDRGTGIGCVDADGDGKRDLVGLDVVDPQPNATTVHWTRTIVTLDGTTARNGATDTGTYTSPADDPKIALLHDVTCGDLTMDDAAG